VSAAVARTLGRLGEPAARGLFAEHRWHERAARANGGWPQPAAPARVL